MFFECPRTGLVHENSYTCKLHKAVLIIQVHAERLPSLLYLNNLFPTACDKASQLITSNFWPFPHWTLLIHKSMAFVLLCRLLGEGFLTRTTVRTKKSSSCDSLSLLLSLLMLSFGGNDMNHTDQLIAIYLKPTILQCCGRPGSNGFTRVNKCNNLL